MYSSWVYQQAGDTVNELSRQLITGSGSHHKVVCSDTDRLPLCASPPVNQSALLHLSVCILLLMGLFPHSFKFHMDSLYISWQLSRSRKKERKKSQTKRACEEEAEEESGERRNGKHFLFLSVSVCSRPLSSSPPGPSPKLFEKPPPPPRFLRGPFLGVVCNNGRLCYSGEPAPIYRISPSLQAWDLPPVCFLDSYTTADQHSQRGRREEDTSSITIESCVLLFFLRRYIDPIPPEHC